MFKLLRKLFTRKESVLELSDGDRAALHGWPDKTVEEVMQP